MDFQIDESKLLYGLGAFLGVVAILYFGHELIFDLSPMLKAFVLLSGTAVFLSAAEYSTDGILQSSLYVFSAFSYLSFLVYIFVRFQFSSQQTFLILAASSAAFLGLGYLRSGRGYGLDREQAKKILAGLVILIALLVVFDVLGSQPEYSLELNDSVQIVEGEEFQVGVFQIENQFLLSRNVDVPSFRGCVSREGETRPIFVSPESRGLVPGGTTERLPLTDTVRSRPDRNMTFSGNYSVERGECPGEPGNMTIYIEESGDRPILSSVAED